MAPKVSTGRTNLSALKLPPCGPVVLINLNICILTEGINFEAILKENCPIALENRCIFTKNDKHETEDDIDGACGICTY